MTWHCERGLFLYVKACSWCSSEILFLVELLLYRSKNIFSTSCMLFAWLAILHVSFVLNSVLIVMYTCQCVCTIWNFYILFCVGMLGGNCGWSIMAWQMNLSQLTAGYSYMFMRWTLVLWCNMMGNSHVFHMFWSYCNFLVDFCHVRIRICYSWYGVGVFHKNVIYVSYRLRTHSIKSWSL